MRRGGPDKKPTECEITEVRKALGTPRTAIPMSQHTVQRQCCEHQCVKISGNTEKQ